MTPTDRAHINDWLIGYRTGTRSEYRREIEAFAIWWQSPLLDAHRVDIQRWLSDLGETDSPATLRRKASSLSSFYTWAVQERLIEHNPCDHLRRPKGDPEPQKGLDLPEAKKLIATAKTHSVRAHALIWLLCGAGLRVAEACGALIEDLDPEGPSLTVTVKGGHRKIRPLSVPVLTGITPAIGDRTTGRILTNRDGRPLTPQRAWELVTSIAATAGIKDCHPHTLRHTSATLALAAGVPVQDVQELLGHRSIETTMRYLYNRNIAAATRAAADKLGTLLIEDEDPA